MKKNLLLSLFILSFCIVSAQQLTQTIRGKILDALTHAPLPGAQVIAYKDSAKAGAAQADASGQYRLSNIPVGRIFLEVKFIGYQPITAKVELTSAKELVLNFSLEESAVQMNEVEVVATQKGEVRNEMAPVSARTFTIEEANRYAGSRSDPARMASNFAGVQGADDSRNDIVVRGNSPLGILWRLEGVDIPNPNHFAIAGSTGGPVNIINSKTLENSEFYTGAFPSEYGNANAGVFDLRMRNGNNEKHEFTGQFGFLGTELAAEGPLSKLSGSSFMFTYRYSTLKLFEAMNIRIGTSAVPLYQDAAFKLNFPGQDGSNFSVFGVGGTSKIDILVSTQTEPTEEIYGDKDRDQYFSTSMGVIGANYTKPIGDKDLLKIVVAHSASESHSLHQMVYRDINFVIDSIIDQMKYRYLEQRTSVNTFVQHKYSSQTSLKYGVNFSYYNFDMVDSNRNVITYQFEIRSMYKSGTSLVQPFAQFRYKPTEKFLVTAGLHAQYFQINGSSSIEPRAGFKWSPRSSHTISFGTGLHSQMLPTYIYFMHVKDTNGVWVWHNKNVGFLRSWHNVLSYDWYISKHLRIKAETYFQYLYDIPVDNYPSAFSMLNQGSGFNRFFPDTLVNEGTGTNVGVEFTLERSFSNNYFYMLTASLYDSKYKGSDGVTRHTDFNGNFAVNALLVKEFKIGQKKNSVLSLGTKVTWAGGKRYTPADTAASALMNELIGIDSLTNTLRFKNYFRFDIKVGFRANRKKVTHELGLDLVNVLGIKNVLGLTYAPDPKNPSDVIREDYQLGFLPLFYYKLDF